MATAARHDLNGVIDWTREHFGAMQVVRYGETIRAAIRALQGGPNIPGSVARDDLRTGLRILHVTRQRRRGRHLLVYRVAGDQQIEVARILHDSMDLRRHLPD